MILSVKPGRRGHFSRNNDSECTTREMRNRGNLSLGIMILSVEPGRRGSFVSRNNDSECRTREVGVICL